MRKVAGPLVKLVLFLVITALATYVLAVTISNESFGPAVAYKADFTDVSQLELGDDVRIAGVRVGTVQDIRIERRKTADSVAQVTFTVQKSRPLPKSVTAHLRYRNLVGQRYIDIEQGAGNPNDRLPPSAVIPIRQTYPAVDLTVLFGGFEPLTQGLDANQINKLSYEVIQTLQGEGGALESLLSTVADLTNSLADKDKVIGDLVDNLNGVLNAVGERDSELSQLIVQLTGFIHGLAADRKTIGNAIVGINGLATSTSGLLTHVRPSLKQDIGDLSGLIGTLNANTPALKYVLHQLPPTVAGLIRTADYGSWFNFYLCQASVSLTLPNGQRSEMPLPAGLAQNSNPRCS